MDSVPKMFGVSAATTETKTDESMEAGELGHERRWKSVQNEC